MTAPPPPLYLIDSSMLIPALRRSPAHAAIRRRVDELIAMDTAATTGVVRLEILSGTRTTAEFDQMTRVLDGLHQLPVAEHLWDEAGRIGAQLRAAGLVPQTTDLVIAVTAMHAGAVLVHRDADFDAIARHVPLLVESYV